jgi:hypothetical protein
VGLGLLKSSEDSGLQRYENRRRNHGKKEAYSSSPLRAWSEVRSHERSSTGRSAQGVEGRWSQGPSSREASSFAVALSDRPFSDFLVAGGSIEFSSRLFLDPSK